MYYASEESNYMVTLEYLKTLAEFAKIIEGSLSWTDATTFMHYYNMQSRKQAI